MELYSHLHGLLCRDETGRGFARAVPAPDFDALTASLLGAERAVILTGFPVDCGGFIRGETDGPGGAANLARALIGVGCGVTLVTDAVSLPLVQSAARCLAPEAEVICLPDAGTEGFGEALLKRLNPTHFITIERPGKGADGHFHSMRGAVLDAMVTDTDFLLPLAKKLGAVTVAIGDGGNELGMGAFYREIAAHVPHGEQIAAVETADFTLAAGVSNWWGWGVETLLSAAVERWLLPTGDTEARTLSAVVDAGAVDGCTHEPTLSVDALPLETHLELLSKLEQLLDCAASVSA